MGTGAENLFTKALIAGAMVRAAGVSFTNAGARGAFAAGTGTNGVTRSGTGVYTLTLSRAAPSATTTIVPTVYAGANCTWAVEHTSDTVKTIRTFTTPATPAAADLDFDLDVLALEPA
jgi:hypothetical protein